MRIDVYADIACPWCYIGERRLEQAMQQRPDVHIERHWRPFQLQPGLPATGIPWREFAPQKFGGEARANAMFDQVARAGAPDGIAFRFDRVATAANTTDAHRLILFAAEQNREWDMAEALFQAYFTYGRNLNNVDDLLDVAIAVGFGENETRELLKSDRYKIDVAASQTTAVQIGVQGVPFYVINGRYGISGAQPIEIFLQALDHVSREET